MRSHGSKAATWLAAALLAALCAGLLWACSDQASFPEAEAPATLELQHSRRDSTGLSGKDEGAAQAAAPDPAAAEDAESLRSSGYLDGVTSPAGDKRQRSKKAAARNAPDADALSQLAAKTSQSLNQRANEAFEYLGAESSGGNSARSELDVSRSQPAARAPQAGASLREVRGRFGELERFRDAAAAPARQEVKVAGSGRTAMGRRADLATGAPAEAPAISAVERFEQERRSLENLRFQPTSGYWANTYVPGDPVMRWLESRLEKRDRGALQAFAAQPLLLDVAAHQTPQPFDPPTNAAISVFLAADRRGFEGEQRMLVQVGLQGAQRHSRLRPAMSVAIVFDVRGGVSTELAPKLRALLDGFLKSKDVGDRFSLTVAGQPGGTLITPDAFRHGPISVAMNQLLKPSAARGTERPLLSLEQALHQTADELRRSDDPAAPLGSSLVLLVTSQPLGSLTGALAASAHQSAIAGVPVSVVGIGDGVEIAEIEQVALAGQGNLRLLETPAEAEPLVERELSALSQVIARALRLRIRLAPGVKLIEVVGSQRLDTAGANRVRMAEQIIDRRMARNLGIEADRGEDEAGIQIVMPTFYSGDAHAVLLDVVVPGPGPIADVTVRYKDLVYLRNGVAQANLTLGRSAEPPGPLQRNVVKNLLAVRLSETLKKAGRDLMAGGDAQAIASVRHFQTLLEGLRHELPGFQNDADLAEDADMLEEYLAMLDTGALQQEEPRQYLADSLQLSGYFKTVPRR